MLRDLELTYNYMQRFIGKSQDPRLKRPGLSRPGQSALGGHPKPSGRL